MSRYRIPCVWRDPVRCVFVVTDGSLYRGHERILTHLNETHSHGEDPLFYVEYEDGGRLHHLGAPKREEVPAWAS